MPAPVPAGGYLKDAGDIGDGAEDRAGGLHVVVRVVHVDGLAYEDFVAIDPRVVSS